MNAEEIQTTYYRHYEKEAKKGNNRLKRPLQSIRASLIGKCARQIYYMMVEPQEGIGWYSPEVVMRLKDGERHERWMVIDLQEMGFDIINQQRSIDDHPELKKRKITGHIEFQIRKEKELLPCEIKSMTTHSETSINSAADFDELWYYRHYPDQAQIYMYGLNAQSITYIIKNKDNSKPNIFDMPLDMERVRLNLDKADLINSCVKAKEPPPRQKWCEECAGCSFLQYCLPDIRGDGKLISLEQPEAGVIELLERKNELSESYKEYEKINKLLKEYWKSRLGNDDYKLILMGDWKFEIKRVNRKGYVVDPFSFASAKAEKVGGDQ
jgi:CRISPR/Cas system-associated exonuclease Cas4 (RecB family)